LILNDILSYERSHACGETFETILNSLDGWARHN
jgi:hypothetical protein